MGTRSSNGCEDGDGDGDRIINRDGDEESKILPKSDPLSSILMS